MPFEEMTNPTAAPAALQLPSSFENAVQTALQNGQIKEYELMQRLVEDGFDQFQTTLDPLSLFRSHFLLFHLLYRLQEKWLNEKIGYLHIETLCIGLRPLESQSLLPQQEAEAQAKLRTYYLDENEYQQTQEQDVLDLLASFWTAFGQTDWQAPDKEAIEEAKQHLEIDVDNWDEAIVTKQFRKLSQQHHPDKGGETKRFQVLCHAREVLLQSLKTASKLG